MTADDVLSSWTEKKKKPEKSIERSRVSKKSNRLICVSHTQGGNCVLLGEVDTGWGQCCPGFVCLSGNSLHFIMSRQCCVLGCFSGVHSLELL